MGSWGDVAIAWGTGQNSLIRKRWEMGRME
jgi:hypothetical protein